MRSEPPQSKRPPVVRLVTGNGNRGDNVLIGQRGVPQLPKHLWPSLLVSYVYLKPFLKKRSEFACRDWALDSGAFSARSRGIRIELEEYIDIAKILMETDADLVEIFSLDVIGDHRATLRNTEKMWEAGVPAVPAFHIGEPEDYLIHIAKHYPKIALGGMADLRGSTKFDWAAQCFARVWPKAIHGFGAGTEKLILGLPWHSTDILTWSLGALAFGTWKRFGDLRIRGSKQNLRTEVEWYLELEEKARQRWKREMEKLGPIGEKSGSLLLHKEDAT